MIISSFNEFINQRVSYNNKVMRFKEHIYQEANALGKLPDRKREPTMTYLLVYDITNDKIRKKVADCLIAGRLRTLTVFGGLLEAEIWKITKRFGANSPTG